MSWLKLLRSSISGKHFQGEPDLTGSITSKLDPWMDAALSGLNSGLRRRDSEQVVIYVNMPCAGVVSSAKNMFCISEVTRLLHQYPRTGIAVIVLPNRAGDLRTAKILGFQYFEIFWACFFCRPMLQASLYLTVNRKRNDHDLTL